jgi:hypothetical protein
VAVQSTVALRTEAAMTRYQVKGRDASIVLLLL